MNRSLPDDVMRHIYSFGYSDHRTNMKQICEKLERGKIVNYNIEMIKNEYNSGNYLNLENVLAKLHPTILAKLFIQCSHCNCCTKHCNKRPKYLLIEQLSYTENYDTGCLCTCRQMARFIKRMDNKYDYYYHYEPTFTLNTLFKEQFK